jgi:hypothetical protein
MSRDASASIEINFFIAIEVRPGALSATEEAGAIRLSAPLRCVQNRPAASIRAAHTPANDRQVVASRKEN